jgi:hypothetical protein
MSITGEAPDIEIVLEEMEISLAMGSLAISSSVDVRYSYDNPRVELGSEHDQLVLPPYGYPFSTLEI